MRLTTFRMSAGAIVVAFLLAASTFVFVVPAHADAKDDQFVERLDLEGVPYSNRHQAIRLAKQYCLTRTRPNANTSRVTNKLASDMGWSGSEAWDFASAAVRAYCPNR